MIYEYNKRSDFQLLQQIEAFNCKYLGTVSTILTNKKSFGEQILTPPIHEKDSRLAFGGIRSKGMQILI